MNIEKVGFGYFYIALPVKNIVKAAKKGLDTLKLKVSKSWYCGGCNEYHSGRVIEYSIDPHTDSVCHKHLDGINSKHCSVYLGGERVTSKYLPQLRVIYDEDIKNTYICNNCGVETGYDSLHYCKGKVICKFCCVNCIENMPNLCPHNPFKIRSI